MKSSYMPELPEAETLRRYLETNTQLKLIDRVDIRSERILDNVLPKQLKMCLEGSRFICSKRHGKRIFLGLSEDLLLTIHLGMSGWFDHLGKRESEPAHTRLLINFADGGRLAYRDPRMFGRIGLINSIEGFIEKKNLGPDALEMDLQTYLNVVIGRKGTIKAMLLNQSIVAGLGNLYADESLFQTGIRPDARSLHEARHILLFKSIKSVLSTAISTKADFRLFPESYLITHRSVDGNCPLDGESLRRMRIGGRTSYYCPYHQKL
jgi:formamidopyrimidine-DNA glycosylase